MTISTMYRAQTRHLLLLAALALLPAVASAQTADEIINKYIAARGGLAKLKSVQSERVAGTISFGPGAEGPLVVERKRPLKMHMELNIAGKTLIRVYDGKSAGWIYNPFAPNASVQAMTEADLRNIFDEADFEGPFVDYKTKGSKVEYVGKEDVEGKPAYKLKLTNKNGDSSFYLFDTSTYLIVKWEGVRKVGDKEVPWESLFRDYRDVDGLKYPYSIDSDAPGTDQIQKIVADKIEINIPIDDSRFTKPIIPAAPPSEAPAPSDPPKP